jgi:hypothetical protein
MIERRQEKGIGKNGANGSFNQKLVLIDDPTPAPSRNKSCC